MRKTEIFEVQSDAKLGYSAGNAVLLPIGNLGFWLAGIRLEFEIAKTDGGAPVANQDWLARVATGFVLSGGNRTYVNSKTRDLRSLYWLMRLRQAGAERMPDFEVGSQTFYWPLTLLFNPDPLKFDDQPALFHNIAGIAPDNNLTLEIDWAANTTLGTQITTGTGTLLRVTYLGTYPGSTAPNWYPNWLTTQFAPQQQWLGLSGTFDLPPGLFYRRTSQMFLRGTNPADVRTNGVAANAISETGITGISTADQFKMKVRTYAKQSQTLFEVADDNGDVPGATAAYGAATTKVPYNAGVGYWDWTQVADNSDSKVGNDTTYGLNMLQAPSSAGGAPKSQGAARLSYTVDDTTPSADGVVVSIAHEAYAKYPWAPAS